MTKEDLIQFVDSHLSKSSYKRKGQVWYRDNAEAVTMFALERSRFGDVYYVSLCVNFKDISVENRPKFYKSHSRIRAEDIGEKTEEYLDLENEVDENIRKQKIAKLLHNSLLFLDKMKTTSAFKELLKQFNPRFFWLNTDVQKYLGVEVK